MRGGGRDSQTKQWPEEATRSRDSIGDVGRWRQGRRIRMRGQTISSLLRWQRGWRAGIDRKHGGDGLGKRAKSAGLRLTRSEQSNHGLVDRERAALVK